MLRTRIKICGITRSEDAADAQRLGADALGLNFYSKSSRFITTAKANDIAAVVSPLTMLVGLFVNPEPDYVRSILGQVRLNLMQFHGDEEDGFCNSFGVPWIKAIRVRDPERIASEVHKFPHAKGVLLDSYVAGQPGGTGKVLSWSSIPRLQGSYILAGGLTPENVATAIAETRPYAVDVSSGVESAPGVKDAVKMRAFIEAVERADSSVREPS